MNNIEQNIRERMQQRWAAVECFTNPGFVDAPRCRFVPLKTSEDVERLRSEAFDAERPLAHQRK